MCIFICQTSQNTFSILRHYKKRVELNHLNWITKLSDFILNYLFTNDTNINNLTSVKLNDVILIDLASVKQSDMIFVSLEPKRYDYIYLYQLNNWCNDFFVNIT